MTFISSKKNLRVKLFWRFYHRLLFLILTVLLFCRLPCRSHQKDEFYWTHSNSGAGVYSCPLRKGFSWNRTNWKWKNHIGKTWMFAAFWIDIIEKRLLLFSSKDEKNSKWVAVTIIIVSHVLNFIFRWITFLWYQHIFLNNSVVKSWDKIIFSCLKSLYFRFHLERKLVMSIYIHTSVLFTFFQWFIWHAINTVFSLVSIFDEFMG